MRPITDWCSHCALFFDDSGRYVGKKSLSWKDKHFSFARREFNFFPERSSFFKLKTLFRTTKYYHYNLNDPMPLVLSKSVEPVLDSLVYKSILDSDLVSKLNPKKDDFFGFLASWKGLILLICIGAGIYYFASGGSLT